MWGDVEPVFYSALNHYTNGFTMATELGRSVDTLTHCLLAIRDTFADPSAVSLDDVAPHMEKLEAALNAKALIDASLKERLGLSPREARERLARGRDLFAEPVVDEPVVNEAAESDAAAAATSLKKAREDARREQERARNQAEKVNAEKQTAIRYGWDKLLDAAKGERARLLADALKEADKRTLADLRMMVRRWISDLNREHARPENPNAGMENRGVRIGRRNADGTHTISITARPGLRCCSRRCWTRAPRRTRTCPRA